MPLEIGYIVHHTISTILNRLIKSNSDIDQQLFRNFVERKTARSCGSRPFFEVYYAEKEEVTADDILPVINECLLSFLESERFEWLKANQTTENCEWLIEPSRYGEVRIDGLKAYCRVDYLFSTDGRILILDWKTGKKDLERHTKQLTGYCAWAVNHFDIVPPNIEAIIAYLRPSYEEIELTPVDSDLANFAAMVRSETEEMYAFCRDIEQNEPIEKESFLMTDHLGICKYCNFKELCGRS
jgi:hypothetical protein